MAPAVVLKGPISLLDKKLDPAVATPTMVILAARVWGRHWDIATKYNEAEEMCFLTVMQSTPEVRWLLCRSLQMN
jgi:hypothetical protein